MRRSSILIAVVATGLFSTVSYLAQAGNNLMDHTSHSGHETASKATMTLPSESGQSAFAAIAEIVKLLNSNPETDWSKVSITRLRAHLVDMELLITEATATQNMEGDTITFTVRGTGRTLSAIRSMVPAHSEELNKSSPWNVKPHDFVGVFQLNITTPSYVEQLKLAALGFFGVMATGAHHQAHHLAMAMGERHGH
jgi:hypothetical protein